MRLRQAKKRLWWSKGEGDYISNHRSKNHHENYKKKYLKLRPEYYDEKRGGWVYPSCADIDIVRRANVRLGRWIRKDKKLKEQLKKDMKELIKEAEELYKQIDKAQVRLINARLKKDEEGKKSAISGMEMTMCNASQFLKFLIDRKDNIIDLSEMWNISEIIPKRCKYLIHKNKDGSYDIYIFNHLFLRSEYVRINAIKRLAYVDDLLPKGGE